MNIQRSFNPFRRWRTRIILGFYLYVFLIVLPSILLIESLLNVYSFSSSSKSLILILATFSLALLFVAPFLSQNSFIQPPEQRAAQEEKKAFSQKYKVDLKQLMQGKRALNHPSKMLQGGILALAILFILFSFLNESAFQTFREAVNRPPGSIFLFALLAISAFGITFYLISKGKDHADHFIHQVNQMIPHTRLKFNAKIQVRGIPGGGASGKTEWELHGLFKGREIDLKVKAEGFHTRIRLTLKGSSKKKFELEEKDEKWMKMEAKTLQELFEARFKLSPISYSALPRSFIEKTVKYDRNLFLKVKEGSFTIQRDKTPFLPFYSLEGSVLFLDFLDELIHTLEK